VATVVVIGGRRVGLIAAEAAVRAGARVTSTMSCRRLSEGSLAGKRWLEPHLSNVCGLSTADRIHQHGW
jgi:NAD(P)-dependent dehydrogenase (short-subunit alcohol dehydrogenase family)